MTTDDFAEYHHDHVHRSFLDPLTTLRAEVQKWHDQMITVVETYKGAGTREAINNRMTARAEAAAYNRVLDLIDKRMEAGQ